MHHPTKTKTTARRQASEPPKKPRGEDPIECNTFLVRPGERLSDVRFTPLNGILDGHKALNLAAWIFTVLAVPPERAAQLVRQATEGHRQQTAKRGS